MEYKKAGATLIGLINRRKLNAEEKEAILTAIGVLEWAALGQSRIRNIAKARKEKFNKDTEM